MDIEIWVSGLENLDNFKPVVLNINTMCNPILFTIPHELWTPYLNFGFFRWYNEEHYKWVHRRIFVTFSGPWTRCKYYTNTSACITWLTPEIVKSLKLSKTFQQITRDKNSSIPYFKRKIPYLDAENHI